MYQQGPLCPKLFENLNVGVLFEQSKATMPGNDGDI